MTARAAGSSSGSPRSRAALATAASEAGVAVRGWPARPHSLDPVAGAAPLINQHGVFVQPDWAAPTVIASGRMRYQRCAAQ